MIVVRCKKVTKLNGLQGQTFNIEYRFTSPRVQAVKRLAMKDCLSNRYQTCWSCAESVSVVKKMLENEEEMSLANFSNPNSFPTKSYGTVERLMMMLV